MAACVVGLPRALTAEAGHRGHFPGTNSAGNLVLRKGESKQARAKQRETSRGQCQEAVGDKVMIAHGWKTEQKGGLGLRPRARPRTREPGRSRRQASPSPQSLFRTSRKSFPPHAGGNTAAPCTVKKIQRPAPTLPLKCGFRATDASKRSSGCTTWLPEIDG